MLSARSALLVGDTHADTWFLKRIVLPRAVELEVDAVIVVGDFGYWPSETKFLNVARSAKSTFGVEVWFLDGNHEHHGKLRSDVTEAAGRDDVREPVCLDGMWYLPRGCEVEVGGLRVGVLGGACSIDQVARVEGRDWFREEEISPADLVAVEALGRVDVLLTHDVPSGWVVPGSISPDEMSSMWRSVLPKTMQHRYVLRQGVDMAMPKLLAHGHYHSGYELDREEAWGPMHVVGLNCNGTAQWGRVLSGEDGEPVLSDWV
jgi:predicted phosphodiesterase